MQGQDVKACKRAAARAGFPKELLAGITDTYTQEDVANIKGFQQANNLAVDGKIGQDTLDALRPHMDALAMTWYESFAPAAGYVNPFRDAQGLVPQRTDQGVDFYAKRGSPILAIGKASITRSTTQSGWCPNDPSPDAHSCVQYLLLDGDHAGEEVYVAEYIDPLVKVGDVVEAGHMIARFKTRSLERRGDRDRVHQGRHDRAVRCEHPRRDDRSGQGVRTLSPVARLPDQGRSGPRVVAQPVAQMTYELMGSLRLPMSRPSVPSAARGGVTIRARSRGSSWPRSRRRGARSRPARSGSPSGSR
jgi:Putative peptidoglycan binding domain